MPAKTSPDLAIPAKPQRHTRESIDSHERCRDTYRSILPRGSMIRARLVRGARGHHWYHAVRADDSTSALARLDSEMVQLRNAGITEAEMMAMEQHVARTRALLFGEAPARPLAILDAEDFEADVREERLEKARLRGEATPATLMHEAEANLREAAVSSEKASALYQMAKNFCTRITSGRDERTPAAVGATTGVGLSPMPMGGRPTGTGPAGRVQSSAARVSAARSDV